jgi:tetratricopeptide (TPR) repeat protein
MRTEGEARNRSAGPRVIRLVSLTLLAASALGCALQPAHQQSWTELITTHFEITSSLSPQETQRLAADLEGFHSVVAFMVDAQAPIAPIRTRVIAYDGRGFVRPFDVRGESSFFLPSLRGGVIVLRTGSGWRGDATRRLRHEYGHYLFRQRVGLDRPLWFDEGFGLLVSTALAINNGADVGTPRTDLVRLLNDRIWMKFSRVVRMRDLTQLPKRHRRLFDAHSWILVHRLLLGQGSVARDRLKVTRYFDRVAKGHPAEASFQSAFGISTGTVKSELADQIASDRYGSVKVRIPPPWDETPPLRPIPEPEASSRLGWLSVLMGRPDQASEYFELAVTQDPQLAFAHLGLGAVAKLEARWEEAKPHYARAIELAPENAIVQVEVGAYYHARATRSADAVTRAELAKLARVHYTRSIQIDNAVPETWAVLGATYLLPGEDENSALEPLMHAQELLPSSLEIQLLLANQRIAAGLTVEAKRLAIGVFDRTHSDDLSAAAVILLDSIAQIRAAKEAERRKSSAP